MLLEAASPEGLFFLLIHRPCTIGHIPCCLHLLQGLGEMTFPDPKNQNKAFNKQYSHIKKYYHGP